MPETRAIIQVATNLGLRPGGVECLGDTLIELGLSERIGAPVAARIDAPPFDHSLDATWHVRNIEAIARLAAEQAVAVGRVLDAGDFPVVLGGDDSVLFGCLLAVIGRGPTGLMFIDGHTDYWDTRNGSGEMSDSDLWVATGHGPPALSDAWEVDGPLVEPRRCVVYGHRDRALQIEHHSEDVYATPMLVRNLAELRGVGVADAARHAEAFLRAAEAERVWLHLDADSLDDQLMPAVDWRLPGGLTPDEVVGLARPLVMSGIIAGIDVTIYNPALDDEQLSAGRVLLDVVARILE